MPNFNQQLFFDPKIDIVGKDVPVEAYEKTGALLQGRHDRAEENDVMATTALNKLASSSNPIDRETAKNIRDSYIKGIKERAASGNYVDAEWQTKLAANEAIGHLTGLAERNKQIQQGLEEISKSKDYISDKSRADAVIEYNKRLKSSSFNPEDRTLSGLNVDPFKEAADVEAEKKLLAVIPHMKFSSNGTSNATMGFIDANGKKVNGYVPGGHMVKFTDSGEHQLLTKEDIANESTKYLRADTDFNAMIQRNLNRKGITDPKEREIIGEQMFHQEADKAINSVSTMFDVNNNQTAHNYDIINSGKNGLGFGVGDSTEVLPVDFNVNANEADVHKTVEDLTANKNNILSKNFNPDGSIKQKTINDFTDTEFNLKRNQLLAANPEKYKNEFGTKLVSEDARKELLYAQKVFQEGNPYIKKLKAQNPRLTDREAFEQYSDAKINNAKILMSQYDVQSKEADNTISGNLKRTFGSMPIFDKDGEELKGDDKLKALTGNIHYRPYDGAILLDDGSRIAAGTFSNRTSTNNPSQLLMSDMSQILKAVLDPDVSFETTNKINNSIKNSHFRIIKNQFSNQGGKYVFPEDKIQQTDDNGKVIKEYSLNNADLNEFVKTGLNEVVGPYNQQ